MKISVIIQREGNGYVALNTDYDIASQGETVEQAKSNLLEALELFFEFASVSEIKERLNKETIYTEMELNLG